MLSFIAEKITQSPSVMNIAQVSMFLCSSSHSGGRTDAP